MVDKITVFCYIIKDMTEKEMITVKKYIKDHFPYINLKMEKIDNDGFLRWQNPITKENEGYSILRIRKMNFLQEYRIDLSTDFVFDEHGLIVGLTEKTWLETPSFSNFNNDFPKIKNIVKHLNKRYKKFLTNMKLLEIEKDF